MQQSQMSGSPVAPQRHRQSPRPSGRRCLAFDTLSGGPRARSLAGDVSPAGTFPRGLLTLGDESDESDDRRPDQHAHGAGDGEDKRASVALRVAPEGGEVERRLADQRPTIEPFGREDARRYEERGVEDG